MEFGMATDADGDLESSIELYVSNFGRHPVADREWSEIEEALGVRLPESMRRIAQVFRGGMLGEIEHFEFSASGPNSMVERTLSARREYGLAKTFVVLAQPRGRFFLLDLNDAQRAGESVWTISDRDIAPVAADGLSPSTVTDRDRLMEYAGYAQFFSSMLRDALGEVRRREILQSIPRLTPTKVKQLRQRWSTVELARIWEMLKTGRIQRQDLPSIEVEGKTMVDLRGLTFATVAIGNREEAKRPVWEGIDFSYSQVKHPFGQLMFVSMRRCRMIAADIPQWLSISFEDCDFSGVKLHGGFMAGRFTRCSFRGADLRRVTMGDEFDQCDFSGALLVGAELAGKATSCTWEACATWPGFPIPND